MTVPREAEPSLETAEGRRDLLGIYRSGLLEDTLRFWFPRCVDREHGGFLHFLDRRGEVFDTDKSIWAQGRMSWLLLKLHAEVERRPEWLEWGLHGLGFLDRHGFDTDGRMFFHVTREGLPIRKRRYAYSESFAAIAYAAAARATGRQEYAERARRLFRFFLQWNFEPGLAPPKFTATRPLIGMGPRMIGLVTAQELRSHLGPDPEWEAVIDRCIGEIRDRFVRPELEAVLETVGADGEPSDHVDGRTLNPGHAIEGAWFILEESRIRGCGELRQLGCRMLDWMWNRGWDQEHGGLFYFRDVHGKPPQEYWHDMKFWWPHDEAIIATTLAWELSGESRYAAWHGLVHDWAHRHFADPEHGEWFGYLHRDGTVSTPTKGNLWKSCFHHPRMQLVCWQALERMCGEKGRSAGAS
jgi:N-acylglucosamine 2-epimerase